MRFSKAAAQYVAPVRTTNGMAAEKESGSLVLDLFNKIGSSRGLDLTDLFFRALAENEELTLRVMLWARDIRGGAGEREQFRNLLRALELRRPDLATRVLHKAPELGRWDDVLAVNTDEARSVAFSMVREALNLKNGLAAKWMPRKGKTAAQLANFLGLSPKQYRKLVVGLSQVVESQMCKKQWNEINFSHVPSVAAARYQKAFKRNAPEYYTAYLQELQKPVEQRDPAVKINASAVYPYDVLKSLYNGNETAAQAQWDALPDYLNDNSVFPIVDTSGSMGYMYGTYGSSPAPIQVAVSLGLYVAERNKSDFKDLLMIFSERPALVQLRGSLAKRVKQMKEIIASNTNLHAAFDMLLDIAVKGKVPQEHMPKTLLILSDMQFDECVVYDDTAQQMIRRKYTAAGYEVPRIVYWNLNAYNNNVPVRMLEDKTALVSGFSPAILKAVLANDLEEFTPYSVMLKTIMTDRYAV